MPTEPAPVEAGPAEQAPSPPAPPDPAPSPPAPPAWARHRAVYLLLAAVLGAIATAAVVLLTTPASPGVGVVASAEVTATASCTGGGSDTVLVAGPGGPVSRQLDGCGTPVGTSVLVNLAANGAVPARVALAGTRAGDSDSTTAVLVLAGSAVLAVSLAALAVRSRSRRDPAAAQG